jgi:translation initiation factor IF-3
LKKFYRVNQYIKSPQVRVLDPEGKQVGVLSLPEALSKAQEFGLDLVEVAQNATPPVCRIIDFKKFKYLEDKKESNARKAARNVETKEVRLRPFTSEGDLAVRLKRVKEFLEDGDRVKVVVKFIGREIAKPDFGRQVIGKITDFVNAEGLGKIDREPRFEGKNLVATYTPGK